MSKGPEEPRDDGTIVRIATIGLRVAIAWWLLARILTDPAKPTELDPGLLRTWNGAPALAFIVAVAIAASIFFFGARASKTIDKAPRWAIDLLLAAIAFFLVRKVTFAAFGGVPQVQDEIAYDLLARRISIFVPVPHSHPLGEFFRIRFLVDDGNSYPLFQPGWPLLLAFGHLLHAPTVIPALATSAFVVTTSRFTERLYGRLASLVAAALLTISAFVEVIGASFFAHALAGALVMLTLDRLVAALQTSELQPHGRRATRQAIAAGLAAAWLFVTRMPNAAAIGPAVLAVIACHGLAKGEIEQEDAKTRRREGLEGAHLRERATASRFGALHVLFARLPRLRASARRPLLAFLVACALGPVAQVGWNLATTRSAFELPQDRWFSLTEPNPDCHRLGFGPDIGCKREHPLDIRPEGYTVARAIEVTKMRWAVFRNDAWGSAVPLALVVLFLARRLRARDAIAPLAALGPFGVYFLFYYHAIQHGARLYAEVMGPLAAMIAIGVTAPFAPRGPPPEPAESASARLLSRLHGAVCALAIAAIVLTGFDELSRDVPERCTNIAKIRQAERVNKSLDDADVHHAIVYMANCIEPDRQDLVLGWASVLNARDPEKGDRWLVRDFDPPHDRQMVTMYPEWNHVRADCNGHPIAFPNATPSPDLVITEAEAKFPPDAREGSYAILEAWPGASHDAVLAMDMRSPTGSVRFRQHLFVDGNYQVDATVGRKLDGGRFALAIDGVVLDPPLDSRGMRDLTPWHASSLRALTAGVHVIELRSIEGAGVYHDALDRLDFTRVP